MVSALAVSAARSAHEASANAKVATAQAAEATREKERYQEQRTIAEAQTRRADALRLTAERNAAALGQALAAQKALGLKADAEADRLAKELYAANVAEIPQAWADGHFDRVVELVRAAQGPNANWEWGFWHRLAGARIYRDPETHG